MKNTSSTGRSVRTALAAASLILCALPFTGRAQQAFTFTVGGLTYSENFDSMGTSSTFVTGWTSTDSTMLVGAGTANNGSIYNVGSNGSSDRAFGSIASASVQPIFGASFLNSTGGFISTMSMSGFSELWRSGSNALTESQVFEFSLDATSLTSGTWTAVSDMNLVEPNPTLTSNQAQDGNLPGNRLAVVTPAPIPLAWADATTIWIRWKDTDVSGGDALIALDDFSMTVTLGTAPKNLLWSAASGVWDNSATNWKNVDNNNIVAFATGDNVTFDDTGIANNNVAVAAGGITPGSVTVDTAGTYTIGGGPVAAITALQKKGTGTLVLGSAYAGGLALIAGTVRTTASEVFGNASGIVLGDGITLDLNGNSETVGTVELTGATITTGTGTLTIGGTVTILPSPTDVPTTISGNLSNGGATRKYVITDGVAAEDLLLNANLTGAGRVDFDGSGAVRIAGNNTAFSGSFQLDSGFTYIIATPNALGTGQLFLNGGIVQPLIPFTGANKFTAPVSLGGGSVTFSGNNFEFGGTLATFGSNSAKTFTVEDGITVTFSGSLSGLNVTGTGAVNSNINKAGSGRLVIAGNASGYGAILNALEGKVDIDTALGAGIASIHDGAAAVKISVSQVLADLTIDDGGVVTLVAPALPAPEFGGDAGAFSGEVSVQPVPEPGSLLLLFGGIATVMGMRRRN